MRMADLVLRLAVAVILGQTLYFKFLGAPESVEIFSTLGVEPWGRFLTAILELVAVILVLIPSKVAWGALLSAGLMMGAILSHLTLLGISVGGDGGVLFGLAVITLGCSLILVWRRREQLGR